MIILLSITILVLSFVFVSKVRIGVNVTDSMPKGIYIMTGILDQKFNKNDVIAFCPSESDLKVFYSRKYLSEDMSGVCYEKYGPFIKHILAKHGDEIEVRDDSIYLNGKLVQNSKIFSKDKVGRSLSRLPNGYKKILLEDEFFAFSSGVTHSLDSRYLGLIKKEKIVGKSHLILRFN